MRLFRTKPVDQLIAESEDTEHGMQKVLTATNLVLLGVGCVIGTGIFVLTGTAAAMHAGPAITLSFLLSGVGCVFAGLCYAEFASMLPIAGSAYTYSYATLGEFMAWIIGWDLILEYLFASSTVAVGWSGYMVSFLNDFGVHIPEKLCDSPVAYTKEAGWYLTGNLMNLPSVFIIVIISALLIVGIKESTKFNNIIVFVKVAVVLLFIGFGASYINSDNWTPYIPENTGIFGQYGISGIFTGAGVIFFAYIGFDAISTAAQETKNPKRDMPIGILGSLLVCMILYVAVSAVLTGIVDYRELNVAAPIAVAIDKTGEALFWLRPLIKIGAIAGLSSVILVLLLAQPRIFYTMAKDGLLPKSFSRLHPKYRTPHVTTILTGGAAAIMSGLLPLNILGELVSIGTLLAFVIVCASVLILRIKKPGIDRPFRTPWVPFVPVMGMAICLSQMIALPLDTWLRLFGWMGIGIVVYFMYSYKHSRLQSQEKGQSA
ncbi:MAG: amino acid permease [Mangrovibacterium sp.]